MTKQFSTMSKFLATRRKWTQHPHQCTATRQFFYKPFSYFYVHCLSVNTESGSIKLSRIDYKYILEDQLLTFQVIMIITLSFRVSFFVSLQSGSPSSKQFPAMVLSLSLHRIIYMAGNHTFPPTSIWSEQSRCTTHHSTKSNTFEGTEDDQRSDVP